MDKWITIQLDEFHKIQAKRNSTVME